MGLKWRKMGVNFRAWGNGMWSAYIESGISVGVYFKNKPVYRECPIKSAAEGMRLAERFLCEVKQSLNEVEGI